MVRMTLQKKILKEAISKMDSFFDAYLLHQKVARKDKRIGLATIYRFLNSLENKGEIHSFSCDNKKIYSTDVTSHAHFRCEICSKARHIKIKKVDFLKEVSDEKICHFQIELAGICRECENKQ